MKGDTTNLNSKLALHSPYEHPCCNVILVEQSEETEVVEIASRLMVTNPLSDNSGYTWTLASIAGQALKNAEEMYGRRIGGYTLLGVEFREGVPQLWYPGNCGNVVIQLGTECLNQPERACFQLAHEVIHLLSPTGKQDANTLEEGLATHFQCWFMTTGNNNFWEPTVDNWAPSDNKYIEAKSLVEELLKFKPNAIKELRKAQPVISHITEEQLLTACPDLNIETAAKLVRSFY